MRSMLLVLLTHLAAAHACGVFRTPHGIDGGEDTPFGQLYHFTCEKGYAPTGPVLCRDTWTAGACHPVACGALHTPHGVDGGEGTRSGTSYSYACEQGYTPSGDAACFAGEWSPAACNTPLEKDGELEATYVLLLLLVPGICLITWFALLVVWVTPHDYTLVDTNDKSNDPDKTVPTVVAVPVVTGVPKPGWRI